MPTIVLSPDEFMFLSAMSVRRPGLHFPLPELLEGSGRPASSVLKEIYEDFLQHDLIMLDQDGLPYLDPEMAIVFAIVNDPDLAVSIDHYPHQEIPRHILCSIKDRWVVLSVGKNNQFFSLTYTFSFQECTNWFQAHLTGRELFKGHSFKNNSLQLSTFELSMLAVMQGIYLKRANAKGAILEGEELQVPRAELTGSAALAEGQKILHIDPKENRFVDAFLDSQETDRVLEQIVSKGLLSVDNGKYAYTAISKAIFDPGKIINALVFQKPDLVDNAKTLYILESGFLVMKPVFEVKGSICLDTFPVNTNPGELFSLMMSWEKPEVLFQRSLDSLRGSLKEEYLDENRLTELLIALEVIDNPNPAGKERQAMNVQRPALSQGALEWFVAAKGEKYGPYSSEKLQIFALDGIIKPASMVWRKGMPDWVAASQVEGLIFPVIKSVYNEPPPLHSRLPVHLSTAPPSVQAAGRKGERRGSGRSAIKVVSGLILAIGLLAVLGVLGVILLDNANTEVTTADSGVDSAAGETRQASDVAGDPYIVEDPIGQWLTSSGFNESYELVFVDELNFINTGQDADHVILVYEIVSSHENSITVLLGVAYSEWFARLFIEPVDGQLAVTDFEEIASPGSQD
jgi:hypothetical protein